MKIKKVFRILRVVFVFMSVGIIPSYNAAAPAQPPAETRIVIFHVNDCHGKIDNFARIAWYVGRERKENKDAAVFFLSAGDNFSGNPVVDQYEPKGEPVLQLMNRMGFSALTPGNHEFDYGQEILKNFIGKAKFPVLCANVKVKEDSIKKDSQPFPQFRPFTILETGKGIKIAVLGLVQVEKDTGIPSSHPMNLEGLTFTDPVATALKYRYLKKEAHVFIALTHLGYETDRRLARKMEELDVIIGGHSHTRVDEPRETNGVLIAQAKGQAEFLGRVELVLEKGRVIQKSGKLIEVAAIKNEIPELKELTAKFNDNPVLNRVIGVLPREVKGKMELGNLITDASRKIHRLDITFHNSGGIRSNRLGKSVRIKDIYSLHPFGNQVIRIKMTPAEIRSLIAYDYRTHKGLDLQVSGLSYVVTAGRGHIVKKVELQDPQGRLLDENKTYHVGVNDYMAASYSFEHRDPGRSLQVTLAETMIRYLREGKDICRGIDRRRTFEIIAPHEEMTRSGETRTGISAGDNRFSGSIRQERIPIVEK